MAPRHAVKYASGRKRKVRRRGAGDLQRLRAGWASV